MTEEKICRITEGLVSVEVPKDEVFYNPTQVFNRDFSTLIISAYARLSVKAHNTRAQELIEKYGEKSTLMYRSKGYTCIEALGASGLRSLRYAKEIDRSLLDKVICNDIDPYAVKQQEHNRLLNNLDSDHFVASCADAIDLLQQHRKDNVTFVDLDPYGSPTLFLDSAINAVCDKGLLLVTSTDLQVLCTTMQPDTCFTRYKAIPTNLPCCHELGLRIAIQHVMTVASTYGVYAEPILSFHHNHYQRIMYRMHRKKRINVKKLFSEVGVGASCQRCGIFELSNCGLFDKECSKVTALKIHDKCFNCGGNMKYFGPIFTGKIHDKEFVECVVEELNYFKYLQSFDLISSCLTYIKQELDSPLFFTPASVARGCKSTQCRTTRFASALISMGYDVSATHCCADGIKTNATMDIVYRIHKEFLRREHSDQLKDNVEDLLKDIEFDEEVKGSLLVRNERKNASATLFKPPPEAGWGPKKNG